MSLDNKMNFIKIDVKKMKYTKPSCYLIEITNVEDYRMKVVSTIDKAIEEFKNIDTEYIFTYSGPIHAERKGNIVYCLFWRPENSRNYINLSNWFSLEEAHIEQERLTTNEQARLTPKETYEIYPFSIDANDWTIFPKSL